jgi:hypothetical protein
MTMLVASCGVGAVAIVGFAVIVPFLGGLAFEDEGCV